MFLAPLVYIQNQEFIDEHFNHAHHVINEQATQVKDLTAHHAGKGFESVKAYSSDYAAKAGEMVGSARQKIPVPATTTRQDNAQSVNGTQGLNAAHGYNDSQSLSGAQGVKSADFPIAPNSDLPSAAGADTVRPVTHEPAKGEPVAASY